MGFLDDDGCGPLVRCALQQLREGRGLCPCVRVRGELELLSRVTADLDVSLVVSDVDFGNPGGFADVPEHLVDFLRLRLAELEVTNRHQRMVQRRIRAARFPATNGVDTFDFSAIPSVNQPLVMQLARCEYVERRENVIAIGNRGPGKTHVALGLGLAACQRGLSVGFTTAAALVNELVEARDERRLLNLQRQLARLKLLIIDELGFVPLSHTGAELLLEVFSQRYERGSILVTTNLPFDEWAEVFASERLTDALLDRLTHHVHILEMNGESYRLRGSRQGVAVVPASDRSAAG